jgi:hypothetical protein
MSQRGQINVVFDPNHPPAFFDGLLDVFTTCRACGTLMKVIRAEEHSHPCCPVVQTQEESLQDLWLSEILKGDEEQAAMTEKLLEESAKLVDLQSAALDYASYGWPVFPLGARSKVPAIPKDKGGKGFKDAHTDEERIRKYWRKNPDHNIGLATGHGFDVIDIDTKDSDGNPSNAGVNSLMQLLEARKIPECHGVAVTASGGMHLYVKPTGKGNFAGLRPGIDYRGVGGYVVAPPSLLRGPGRSYTWLIEPSPIIKGDW